MPLTQINRIATPPDLCEMPFQGRCPYYSVIRELLDRSGNLDHVVLATMG
jgi:hypothetical protein